MEIYNTILAQFKNIMSLRPVGFVRHLAKILSGTYTTLDNLIQWVALQIFPTTASDSEATLLGKRINPLEQWAAAVGLSRKQATKALIELQVTNSSSDLYNMPAGTRFIFPATGVTYSTQEATIFAPSQSVSVQVLCDTVGTVGNVENSVLFEVAEANSYLDPEAEVLQTLTVAEDTETGDELRTRLLKSLRNPPLGGSYADYTMWGSEVEGVTGVYPYRGTNPGEVKVYVRDVDGVPSQTQLTEVVDSINLPDRRPVGAVLEVLPVSEALFSFTVEGLTPDTDGLRDAVKTSLEKYLNQAEPFVTGYNFATLRKDRIVPAAIGGEVNSAVLALGGTVNRVKVYKDIFEIDQPYSLQEGEIGKLVKVSYVK